jgi:predicted membrane protein
LSSFTDIHSHFADFCLIAFAVADNIRAVRDCAMDNNFDDWGQKKYGDYTGQKSGCPQPQFGGLRQNWSARQGVGFAICIIVFGVLLFLDNIGVFPIRDIWQYWPVIFVVIGFQHMVNAQQWAGRVWGGLLVTVGVLWICKNLAIIPWGLGAIGAVFMIGVGFMLLVQAVEQHAPGASQPAADASGEPSSNPFVKEDLSTADFSGADSYIRDWVIFSGSKRRFDARSFRGGNLVAIFGGIELDLRRALADTTQNMVLETAAVFGGIEIRVPETWRVVNRGVAVFGGYDNKTIPPGPSAGSVIPTLVITGSTVFGGVTIEH